MKSVRYCVGSIMSKTSLIYQKICNLEDFTKEKVLKIVEEEIHRIDSELKKISDFIETVKENERKC